MKLLLAATVAALLAGCAGIGEPASNMTPDHYLAGQNFGDSGKTMCGSRQQMSAEPAVVWGIGAK